MKIFADFLKTVHTTITNIIILSIERAPHLMYLNLTCLKDNIVFIKRRA